MAAALEKSEQEFVSYVNEQQRLKREEQERMRRLLANPFDEDAQRLIAEEIRKQNVEKNMEAAMEYHPESFGQVSMLYINCRVNGHPVKAFIDSGRCSAFFGFFWPCSSFFDFYSCMLEFHSSMFDRNQTQLHAL